MKKLISLFLITLFTTSLFAQAEDDFFFEDEIIEEVTSVKATSDLSKGILFQTGSIKVGGSLNSSLETSTVLYSDDDSSFVDNIKDTSLVPSLNSTLNIDARPTETLRIYTKFGFAYPFVTTANIMNKDFNYVDPNSYVLDATISDYLKIKEAFTDFSIKDHAFFRFGLHTVTWGTGYFFSPISNIINTSAIDPENPTEQVSGSLNLRTQIVFSDSQNCLWLYAVPSDTLEAKKTALAAKYDLVLGGYELGFGGYYQYQNAPKFTFTTSGSLKNVSVFSEFVYQYGSLLDWQTNTEWQDKTSIIQATVGLSYFWKDPEITLMAQYYYDGNDEDDYNKYMTKGHNIAAFMNFGRLFGTTDFTATVFAMTNFGKEELPDFAKSILQNNNIASLLSSATFSAMLNYSPISELKFAIGPYLTFASWEDKPTVALKLNITLGGGKF